MKIPEAHKNLIRSNNPNVTSLDLTSCGLCDDDIKVLVDLLNQNKYITELILYRNNILLSATELAKLVHIRKLDLGSNNIGWQGVKCLVEKMSIEWLNLANNHLTDKGAEIAAIHSKQLYLAVGMSSISKEWRDKVEEKIRQNNEALLKEQLLPHSDLKRAKVDPDSPDGTHEIDTNLKM